ncbi:protein-(glutamine-N5) methyltransferase, release factor-specific [Candidatus Saccharibacteria bacterium CG11_big_fil_rev_8_21_14_0_20_41_19]|nr:peptide chain release factor N(5)-glutamine methyltransferase [Candidatus Saccharibacteria bacterium]OIP85743.1 MAG: protein-(glutamine-N5) methyltransferase, release factor-specific [Candidatus Saccharibacteria bacterium CG2_30_41_52]PIQ70859.1 MAG: protein-(glutamine-N5) methyltransferase, release factor-specific [Candidatus Saccharibacteria bacterium CG11_big_fil_rev_8_21_14_0_20_41_19]PIZ60702.1 MAG: peptide chain release factor N(5)-glutamine methyltransferase [Candidatus Saccharibacteri
MNANSLPLTPAFNQWLADASARLSNVLVPSANLDAEIILAHAIAKDRTYLHAHPEQIIDAVQIKKANEMLEQRLNRVPIAYIIGDKEFYGRQFITTPSVLIPRPESETIIDLLKEILLPITYYLPPTKLIDIGTGSGNLGITAKLEFPNLDVTLTDVSGDALKIAAKNSIELSVDVKILQSDLLENYSEQVDIIIANLPYVDKVWERSTETNYEPDLALFANNHGLSLIERLIAQSEKTLVPGGYIILESDPIQHKTLIDFANKKGLSLIKQQDYIFVLRSQC